MFKKLKKERGKILLLFLLESLIVVGALNAIISLYHIEFVEKYSLFILLLFLIVANFFNIFAITKLLSKTEKYLNRTDITISSIFGNEVSPVFEFGDLVILVYNENDEIIWVSQTTLLKKDDILGQKVYDLISDFDVLTTQEKVKSNYTEIGGKTFEIEINTGLKVVYLKDVSTKVMQDIKVEQERPFIGNIVIDNYQDIIISLGEADFVAYVTEIKEEVMAWAKKYNLFIRSYGNDSFLIVGEEKNYQAILKDNFSIIEELRIAAQKNDNPLTISIGIGKGNTTSILRTSELSYMALNMALSRGGDQVVVNTFGKQLQYYGAKNEVKQTRSHVRGRVLAKSLASLIRANKSVIIMGHKNMDFDALGASLGVWALCKSLRTKAYVVYEDDLVEFQTKRAFRQVFDTAQINEMTVTPLKALQMVTDQTLVVVVDTHRPDSTMQPKILDRCKEVCVIDHHRKGAHFINNPMFQYHEPQSSSASELVTELIFYQTTKVNVSEQVANFLLSGICLDTKFFKSGVSGKTFEMAMNLKNYQASVEAVNEYFKEEYEEMKLISGIVNSAKVLSPGIFMATRDEEDIITRTALSKAAAQRNSTSIAEVASELEETVKVFLRDGGRV